MNQAPLNLTVRVGCNLAYEASVPTAVLFVLKPRLEGRVLVMQERLSFGIGLPSYEFQDSHGNITYRSTLMPGRNEIQHVEGIAPLVVLAVSGTAIRRGQKRTVILCAHRNGGGHDKCHQAHETNASKSSPADHSHVSLPPDYGPQRRLTALP